MTEEELLKQAQLASAREFEANQEKQLQALASTDNCKNDKIIEPCYLISYP